MWRKCDLHRHTTPDDTDSFEFDAQEFVNRCIQDGLDVVAVTDHDRIDHIQEVIEEAAQHDIAVVPGVELDTDRGHIIALAPGGEGITVLEELRARVPARSSGTVEFNRLIAALSEQRADDTSQFRNHVVLVGAHADTSGSILAPSQPASVEDQIADVQKLHALEVVDSQTLNTWQRGIKQEDLVMALLQGSDAHPTVSYEERTTWMYLPEVTSQWLRHALATFESSICHEKDPPTEPEFWIKSIEFERGPYDGRRIEFSPRANALIGPPSSGKSLVIDAIRFVFNLPCQIEDVSSSIDRRLTNCLSGGAAVKVEMYGEDGFRELRRVHGGTHVPEVAVKPIVFSQVELARRSMEPIPSVALLDIHCAQSSSHEIEIGIISEAVQSSFARVVELAKRARKHRVEVENELEGLEATRSAYRELVNDEKTAMALGDLRRLDNWHDAAKQRIKHWHEEFRIPNGPEMPPVPTLETDISVSDYVPSHMLIQRLEEYQTTAQRSAAKLAAAFRVATTSHYSNVETLRRNVQAGVGEGHDATAGLAEEAERCRQRLAELEQSATELAGVDKEICDGLAETDDLIDRASNAWAELRQARKSACKSVNGSMRSFFVKLSTNSNTGEIDELLNDLRVGSNLQEASVRQVRNQLDRKLFVRAAIHHVQFTETDENQPDEDIAVENARKIANAAMDKEKYDGIANLTALWPSDGIEIFQKQGGSAPVTFDNLTEGLKALAIKEISFAASQFPVVTDQPEDAVPTTAIFEKLVPTLREQRASRQFIIASHDANVVVAGDMDRVVVFPPGANEQPIEGTLFETSIRAHSIALLEGGDQAFELRRRRYGDYG